MRRATYSRHRPSVLRWIAWLPLVAAAASGAASSAPVTGNKLPGYTVFVAKGCFECHGYLGQGSMVTGPALAPHPISLAAMRTYVRAPTGQMPPYSTAILTDTELAQIHDYLASLPAPLPPEKIPLLAQISGPKHEADGKSPAEPTKGPAQPTASALYAVNCASCHGSAGEGGTGPDLRAESSKRGLAETVERIAAPVPPMPKLYPTVISHAEVEQLALYIRALH